MRTIIAGSRSITDYNLVLEAIEESEFIITEVVSGKAQGIDTLGERYAKENNIPIKEFPANWNDLKVEHCIIKRNAYGKEYNVLAGFNRNQDMADYADALIAVTTGSSGTNDMIQRAYLNNLKVYIKLVDNAISDKNRKEMLDNLKKCGKVEV